mgnify:FL=1
MNVTNEINRFNGQVALVTGGTAGIGEAASLAYAKEGAKVVLIGRNSERGNNVVSVIQNAGGTADFIEADVSQSRQVQSFIETTVEKYGRLDVAFNNAGVEGVGGPIHQYPEDEWVRTIDINLKGVWLCMKYQIQQMLNQRKLESSETQGVIVNMASIAGHVASASPDYCASKHGVIGLTKSAALNYASKGIRVNSVSPASIHTPMFDRFAAETPDQVQVWRDSHPIGRIGQPDEVAEAVLWLSSSRANFITGTSLMIDGGWTAQ